MLSGRQSLYAIGAQVLVAIITIIAATVLGYAGKLQGEAITALFGMAIGLAGGTAAVASSAAGQTAAATPMHVRTPEGVTVTTNGAIEKVVKEEPPA